MVKNRYWSFDRALEGVRSLGVVLVDGSFVCRNQACAQVWLLLVPRLQGTAALQVNVVFQGGMASVPSHFSLRYKG